ncbi:YdeI/OmpD-associated family protein [Portibacter marinus]|uniref:YdeI/OmpD-associated family protein n=1 Tax=Portibacter marinus TaxID=2898660 RepID=UPI001F25A83C|nr:DUF1801 domain-containing protein [Portibacter marinus]
MIDTVDNYLTDGCMRCALGGTPDCKVLKWTDELKLLRDIVLDCGLTEEVKWGVPCYTVDGVNVLIVSAFIDYCCISFFKGVMLKDEGGYLVKPGPNSQSARLFKFTTVKDIQKNIDVIKAYIFEAIEIEKTGLKVAFKEEPEPMPKELIEKMENDPVFKNAFESLTLGRRRGYIIYFSGAKQSQTRKDRIEKSADKILNGEGMHDHYKGRVKKAEK